MMRSLFPESKSYSELQKLLHWGVLALCIVQFPTAWAIQRTHIDHAQGTNPQPFDLLLHQVHAFSGWIILGLVSIRILLRCFWGVPALPETLPPWQRKAATINHALLYGVLIALPVTGTTAMYLTQAAVPAHQTLVYFGIGLVALHIAAVVMHVLSKDSVVRRMIPRRFMPGDEKSDNRGSSV